MRRYWSRKRDANQPELVDLARQLGASVVPIHRHGQGLPDLLIGWHGVNLLVEVKQPGGKLTPDEVDFRSTWNGQVETVESWDDLYELLWSYRPVTRKAR